MKSRTMSRMLALFLLLGNSLFLASPVLAAATITVTTTSDTIAHDGQDSG